MTAAAKTFQEYPKMITDHAGKRRKVHSVDEENAAMHAPDRKAAPAPAPAVSDEAPAAPTKKAAAPKKAVAKKVAKAQE